MRQRGTARLLMNARLHPIVNPTRMMGDKGVTFCVANAAAGGESKSEGEDASGDAHGKDKLDAGDSGAGGSAAQATTAGKELQMRTYALRVKQAESAKEFCVKVVEHRPAGSQGGSGREGPSSDAARVGQREGADAGADANGEDAV